MAFIQTAEWQLADRPSRAAFIMPRMQSNGPIPQVLRHLLAIVGSALVHFLLIYFFLNKMLGSGDEAVHPGAKSESLHLFDLSDAKASEPKRSEPAAQQEQAKAQLPAPAPLPPQEWKVAPLAKSVATRALSPPPSANGSSITSMSGAASSSAGAPSGGGNYDPYAGAAPQRLMPQFQSGLQSSPGTTQRPPITSRDPLELNQDVLNKLRHLAERDGANGNNPCLTVEIGLDGGVKKIALTGGSRSLLKSVRKLLEKWPLYRVTAPLTKVEIRQVMLS